MSQSQLNDYQEYEATVWVVVDLQLGRRQLVSQAACANKRT